ncbi:nuclear transport factor 2 family protein [Arthrobacter sp. 35W]|uniref:nuclear transport factor 2 family protein n=1 Tax=Arthrobacter sp. 35W TaxID=1132441 RepID=UPI0004246C0A|nr:nuclear transport factor 2 family protein [Arthrobacter sp. 35W]
MGAEENADLVRRGYEAFVAGDVETLGGLFADDAVWHVAGSNALSGPKEGRDAILAYFGELAAQTQGSLAVNLDEIIGGEDHTVALQHNTAERDGKTLDSKGAFVFEVRDGKISEAREFFTDTAQGDDFWS